MIVSDTNKEGFVPYQPTIYSLEEVREKAARFREEMRSRRSVREFSDRKIPKGVILEILATANNAPSGAN